MCTAAERAAALLREITGTLSGDAGLFVLGPEYAAWIHATSDPCDLGQAGEGGFNEENG